jgi:hypothetical protein
MDGLRLIKLLDVVPVISARPAVGVFPRSVILQCQELNNVDSVLFNGMLSPSWVPYGSDNNMLIAEVPEPLTDAVITEVLVLSASATMTHRSMIEFTVGTRVNKINGTQRLLQTFIRMLLRTAGSNIFHKQLGGSIYTRVGSNIDSRLAADIAVAITNTKQQIIAVQTPVASIPKSERLLSAEIAGLTPDEANTTVYVTVVVTSHTQQRSAATFAG